LALIYNKNQWRKKMSNELVEIKEQTVLAAFSEQDGLRAVINQAREVVSSFEHDLSTDAGRKRTASLAAKVAKLKTRMDAMGKSLTEDWAKRKKAVDENRKAMRDELDELKAEARRPLDQWEAEQAAIAEQARLAKLAEEREADHEIALLLNEKYDNERSRAIEAERKAEAERQAKLKAEQEDREKAIAEQAAERERQASIEREQAMKAQAEAAERARIAAEERAKIQAEQAEQARILAEKQAAENAKRAAEAAAQAEIARQQAEAQRIADEQAEREANKKHIGAIRKAAKDSLMALGIDEETARKVVIAIHDGEVANIKIVY
jgi:colicin import membrane protein